MRDKNGDFHFTLVAQFQELTHKWNIAQNLTVKCKNSQEMDGFYILQ